jgi:ribosomal protein L11 methyltransferase
MSAEGPFEASERYALTSDGFWTEIALLVRPAASEAVADLLQDITGNGVTIEPPIETLGPDEGYVLDLEAPLRLIAYIRGAISDGQVQQIESALDKAGLSPAVAEPISSRKIREEDWAEAWKEHYEVEKVGRIVIRPAWRDYEPSPDELVIALDPGMAFGTGQHPTTRMCLQVLQEEQAGGLGRVMDLGCGSAILAIAAVALGSERVVAVDTEEQAVAASITNAGLNGMQDRIDVRLGSIEAVSEHGPFDCILANINAAAVTSLAHDMADSLRPEGWLAAGGVIAEREAGVKSALEAAGLHVERMLAEGDWRTFVARKPA